MKKQALTAHDSQFSEFLDYADKLPEGTLFTPARTDDVHALYHERDMPLGRALTVMQNNKDYHNLKFKIVSDKITFMNIDVDDKNDKNGPAKFKKLKKEFKIPDSATIKSPTAGGFHVHLTMPHFVANKVENHIPGFEGIDIFIDDGNKGQRYVMPGCVKKSGKYTLQNNLPLAHYTGRLTETIKVQDEVFNHQSEIRIEQYEKQGGKIDSEANQKAAINYCRALQDSGETIEIGHMDDELSKHAWNIFEHGVSRYIGGEIMKTHLWQQTMIIREEDRDEQHFEDILDRANKRVEENRNRASKASFMDPWERDVNGRVDITHDQMEAKLDFLLDKTKTVRLSSSFLPLTIETIFKDRSGDYFVPERYPMQSYEEEYRFSLRHDEHGTEIDFWNPLSTLKDTKTHWNRIDKNRLDELYHIPGGKKEKPIRSATGFHAHVLEANVHETPSFGIDKYVYRFGQAYLNTYDCLDLLSDEEYQHVSDDVEIILSNMLDYVINEEDRDQFLMRFAKILQTPQMGTPNVPILHSNRQGSGKTILLNLFSGMLPDNKRQTHASVNEVTEKFANNRLVTCYDDVNLDKIKDVNQLKSEASAELHKVEIKFVQPVYVREPVNFFFTTNDEPTKPEFFIGRRWTIYSCNDIFSTRARNTQIFNILKKLKANHYYLYRALKTKLINLDVTEFDPRYKTSFQRERYAEACRGVKIIPFLVAMIHNEGWADGVRIVTPGEETNRLDIEILRQYYVDLVDDNQRSISDYTKPFNISIRSWFNYKTTEESANYYAHWKDIHPDPEHSVKSKIPENRGPKWRSSSNVYPDFESMIALLGYIETGDESKQGIDDMYKKYHFGEKSKSKLGYINPYEEFDIMLEENMDDIN